jgi:isoamylase
LVARRTAQQRKSWFDWIQRLDVTLNELLRRQPFQWDDVKLNVPTNLMLAAAVQLLGYPMLLHVIINAHWEVLQFEVPALAEPQDTWCRCIDTYFDPPDDICSWANAESLQGSTCLVQPRSVVVLLAER